MVKNLGKAILSCTLTVGVLATAYLVPSTSHAAPYRSNDIGLFASWEQKDEYKGDIEVMGDMPGFRIPGLIRSVTPDTNDNDVLIGVIDQSDIGSDWGDVAVSIRRSFDNGKTWDNVNKILDLAGSNTVGQTDVPDWRSAFYLDPIISQAPSGDLVMLVDMFPESRGLNKYNWLDKGSGYVEVDGKSYQALYTGDSRVGNRPYSMKGKTFTIRENGWVYDNNGEKTNYYLPQNHSAEHSYQTMGDLYYAVGEGDYLNNCPPLLPVSPEGKAEGQDDIYAGNIYLNYKKPNYKKGVPDFVQKVQRTKDEGDVNYDSLQTSPAPLFAPVTCYLWVSTSSDNGATWSQPVDITNQVKQDDEKFLGTGPGVGLTLQNQKDDSKNGRVLMPLYNLGIAAAIYSDDGGKTWSRCNTDGYGYMNNIDESQFVELEDGTVMSFGRPEQAGPTPVSYSNDGGESWSVQRTTDLTTVKCQKSLITYPMNSDDSRFAYCEGMTEGKQYVLASYPTDNSRVDGAVALGEVQEDKTIQWIAQRRLEMDNTIPVKDGEKKPFGYSCMTVQADGTIGVLAETQAGYTAYGSFNLEWIFKGDTQGEVKATRQQTPGVITLNSIFMDIKKGDALTSFVKPGTTLEFTVNYSDAVQAVEGAVLPFTMDKKEFQARYLSGGGTKTLTYSYEVQKGDVSKDYPLITANPQKNDSVKAESGTIELGTSDGYQVYNTAKPHNVFALGAFALQLAAYAGPFLALAVLALICLVTIFIVKRIKNKKS